MANLNEINRIRGLMGLNESEELQEDWKSNIIAAAMAASSLFGPSAKGQSGPQDNGSRQQTTQLANQNSVVVPVGKLFASGKYILQANDKEAMTSKFKEIGDFIKAHPNSDFEISINSSESQVPNKDAEAPAIGTNRDGTPIYATLDKGELAQKRANTAMSMVNTFVDTLKKDTSSDANFKVNPPNISIGTTPYLRGDNPDDTKFTKEQYTNITIKAVARADKFAAYAKEGEVVYRENKHPLGQIFYKSRATVDIRDAGSKDTGHEDVLLKLQDENGNFTGKNILIPSQWFNNHITSERVSDQDVQSIMNQQFN